MGEEKELTPFRPQHDLSELARRLPQDRLHRLICAESHTAGELTRIVLGGGPELGPGKLSELRQMFSQEHDHLRRRLTWEPRGNKDVVVAWLTKPRSFGSQLGLFFMDARRYPMACGTATVGAITCAVELGLVQATEDQPLVVDTPAGPITAHLTLGDNRVTSVHLDMPEACVLWEDRKIELDGTKYLGTLGFVGGFLLMLEQSQLPYPILPSYGNKLVELAERLLSAANEQWQVPNPLTRQPSTIDGVVFFDSSKHDDKLGSGAVVYGASHLDRSPCGTGTALKVALLSHQGRLQKGDTFVNSGLLGTTFQAELREDVMIGAYPGVQVRLKTSAHLIGIQEYFVMPDDPLGEGYLLGEPTPTRSLQALDVE